AFFDAPPEVVRAFGGVGYGYLMLDTLCEAMNHERLLDTEGFWADVTAAVNAVEGGNPIPHLKEAAERIRVAREGLYGGTINLADGVGPNPASPGEPWPASVRSGLPAVVIAAAETLERLAAEHPERFAELKARLPDNLPPGVDVCTGAYRDRDDAILP